MSKEARKLALEALKMNPLDTPTAVYDEKHNNAIKALEETLANHCEDNLDMVTQEQGEPVAQAVERIDPSDDFKIKIDIHWLVKPIAGKLYTTPQQRTWVGLTLADKEEYLALDFGGNRLDAMDWAEQRLKEKNT